MSHFNITPQYTSPNFSWIFNKLHITSPPNVNDEPSNFAQYPPSPPEIHSTQKQHERNYSITELELLSIVFACEKFRVFILWYPVTGLTDHQALTFLFQCYLRNARLTRWTLHLQEFNLQVKHIPGSDNIIDALSRSPAGREEAKKIMSRFPCALTITSKKVQAKSSSFKSIWLSLKEDTNLDEMIQKMFTQLVVSQRSNEAGIRAIR